MPPPVLSQTAVSLVAAIHHRRRILAAAIPASADAIKPCHRPNLSVDAQMPPTRSSLAASSIQGEPSCHLFCRQRPKPTALPFQLHANANCSFTGAGSLSNQSSRSCCSSPRRRPPSRRSQMPSQATAALPPTVPSSKPAHCVADLNQCSIQSLLPPSTSKSPDAWASHPCRCPCSPLMPASTQFSATSFLQPPTP